MVFCSNTISAYLYILEPQPSLAEHMGAALGVGISNSIHRYLDEQDRMAAHKRQAELAIQLQKKEHAQRLLEQERQRCMLEKAHKEQLKQDKIRYGLLFIFMLVFLFTILLILKRFSKKFGF